MNWSSLNILSRLKVSIMSVTTLLVLLMGIAVYVSLTVRPESLRHWSGQQSRQVASVNVVETRVPGSLATDVNMPVQYVDCVDQFSAKAMVVKSPYLRLVGSICSEKVDDVSSGLRIVNKENGYSASSFAVDGGKFTTDFINLNPGKNNLSFVFKSNDKDTTWDMVVQYDPPPEESKKEVF